MAAPGSGCQWSWRGSRKEQCGRALRRNWKRQRERPEGTGIGPREPGPPRLPAEPGPPCPGLSQGWGAASAAGGAAQGVRGPGGVSSLHRGPEWAARAPRMLPSCPRVRGWEPGRAVGAHRQGSARAEGHDHRARCPSSTPSPLKLGGHQVLGDKGPNQVPKDGREGAPSQEWAAVARPPCGGGPWGAAGTAQIRGQSQRSAGTREARGFPGKSSLRRPHGPHPLS